MRTPLSILSAIIVALWVLTAATVSQAQFDDQRQYAPTTGGSANAQTIAIPNYKMNAGVVIRFIPSLSNTGPEQINVNNTGLQNLLAISSVGLAALAPGQLPSGQIAQAVWDGTQYELVSTGASPANSVNVSNFGAQCNNSFNDSTAFQNALNSGLNVVGPSLKNCIVGGVTMISGNGQSLDMSSSNLNTPAGSLFGIKVEGFQPHVRGIHGVDTTNLVSQTTVSGALNTSVAAAYVVAPGSGGSAGTCTLTGTTGTGTKFVGTIVTAGSTLTAGASITITTSGSYSANPTTQGEPVTTSGCGSLTGVTVAFNMANTTTTTQVSAAAVVAGGGSGAPGACTVQGTTGTGTKFQATGTVSGGGALLAGLVVTVQGAYNVGLGPTNLASEPVSPVTGCAGLSGATVSLTMYSLTTIGVASTANGPGMVVGQRYQVQKTNGSYGRGFITKISGTTITMSDATGSPIASGAPFWATFGFMVVTNAYQPDISDVRCTGAWGCLLLDDPAAGSDTWKGVVEGNFSRISANGGRMFGMIKGRNVQTENIHSLQLWGGWTQVDNATGDGTTTNFPLKFFLNLKREITASEGGSVTVNAVAQVQGVDYTVNTNGLGITFTSAPANAAAIVMTYFTYGGVGYEDNCEALVAACGGNVTSIGNILQWSDGLYFNQSQLSLWNGIVVDGAAFNCVTFDGTNQQVQITDLQAYWCANQIKAKNNATTGSILIGVSSPQPSSAPSSGVAGALSSIDVGSSADWPGGIKTAAGPVYENKNGFQSNFAGGLACWGCPPGTAPIEPFEWYNPLGILYFNGQNTIGFSAVDAYIGTTAPSGQLEMQALGTGGSVHLNGAASSQLLVNSVVKSSCTSTQCVDSVPHQLPASIVSALPSCAAGLAGAIAYVTDALTPAYNVALTGGSVTQTLAMCNGTAWVAH